MFIGILFFTIAGRSQSSDSTYQTRKISRTDIEILYSMYNQEGDHSAVTGGIGTEKLNVYAPSLNLDFENEKRQVSFGSGVDVISSASTDNIDFEVSSASLVDIRAHADVDYSRRVGKNDLRIGIGTGFSFESDYLSIPVRTAFSYTTPNGMRQYQVSLTAFFDDLRWGRRLDPQYKAPEKLIYPEELRYKEWFDIHNRYTYSLRTGLVQTLNKRLLVAIYPGITLQKGLLSTTFHRVYFTNDSVRVENLPETRIRVPLGLRANYFAGSGIILKGRYQFYTDDFGITAHGLNAEVAVKVSPVVTLSPFGNIYSQSGSTYFKPYGGHDSAASYYTSDYDLSGFQSFKAGVGFRWAPFAWITSRSVFDQVQLRYAYFRRSDGLTAHIVSASFNFSHQGQTN